MASLGSYTRCTDTTYLKLLLKLGKGLRKTLGVSMRWNLESRVSVS